MMDVHWHLFAVKIDALASGSTSKSGPQNTTRCAFSVQTVSRKVKYG